MSKKSFFLILLTVLFLSLALAVEDSKDYKSMTLYISGKRLASSTRYLNNKSADTQIITEQEISNSGADNLPELLSKESGFSIDNMGISGKYTINMRGYTSKESVVVIVDGVKQNDINNDSVMWDSIPLEEIERIEIIKGGGSVIFGAGAVGGVINITTKKFSKKI